MDRGDGDRRQLPDRVNAYVVASRFKTGEALSSNAITLTTALAMVTVPVWLHMVEWS